LVTLFTLFNVLYKCTLDPQSAAQQTDLCPSQLHYGLMLEAENLKSQTNNSSTVCLNVKEVSIT